MNILFGFFAGSSSRHLFKGGVRAAAQLSEAMNEMQEITGPVEKMLKDLPEKALNLGLRVLFALIVFFIASKLIKLIRKIIGRSMTRAGAETGVMQFVDSFVKAALYILLAFFLASYFGVDAAGIVALLGSAGVAIGLAVQGSLSNLAGGVLILLLKPFVVGDYIKEGAGGKEGFVEEIHIFYTRLRTFENYKVILPNGSLVNSSIVNYSTGQIRRADFCVSISYKADIRKAREVILGMLKKDEKVLKDKDMVVYVDELGESGVNLKVFCWFKNEDFWHGLWRITENCKTALDEAGIEIPYNQLDVHLDQK